MSVEKASGSPRFEFKEDPGYAARVRAGNKQREKEIIGYSEKGANELIGTVMDAGDPKGTSSTFGKVRAGVRGIDKKIEAHAAKKIEEATQARKAADLSEKASQPAQETAAASLDTGSSEALALASGTTEVTKVAVDGVDAGKKAAQGGSDVIDLVGAAGAGGP